MKWARVLLILSWSSIMSQSLQFSVEGYIPDSLGISLRKQTIKIIKSLQYYSLQSGQTLTINGLEPQIKEKLQTLYGNKTISPDPIQHVFVVENQLGYEVLGITNTISKNSGKIVVPHKHLLLKFDRRMNVYDAYFTPEAHHFQDITQFGLTVSNLTIIKACSALVSKIATLLTQKQSNKLETFFEIDPLIITGKYIYDNCDTIEYRRYSRARYLKRLEVLFKFSDSLDVRFDDMKIKKHPYAQRIYAIQVTQHWDSSIYSDTGYLLLIVDFFNPHKPVIHSRIWRPIPFF